jgi:hypothetical protein
MSMAQQREGLTFKWVRRTYDSDLLGTVVGVGSLWMFPSTICRTSG